VPKPSTTRVIIIRILTIDWQMSMMLLSSILSVPVNAAVAAFMIPWAKIDTEAIWIKLTISGRWNKSIARKPESAKATAESTNPRAISKINPERKTFLISAVLSSARHCAVLLTMAELIPQSLKTPISVGAVKAIPYKPYKSEPSSLAMKIVPTDEITVEITRPQST
jgi:hypothetical protein